EFPTFDQTTYGGETGFLYRPTRNIRTNLLYRLRESEARNVPAGIPPELAENVLISSGAASVLGDGRNSGVEPDKGSTHRVMVEYAGSQLGSQLDFVRVTGYTSWVIRLRFGIHLVTMVRAGAIVRLDGTEVIPLQERFYNGGESTIRSFGEF